MMGLPADFPPVDPLPADPMLDLLAQVAEGDLGKDCEIGELTGKDAFPDAAGRAEPASNPAALLPRLPDGSAPQHLAEEEPPRAFRIVHGERIYDFYVAPDLEAADLSEASVEMIRLGIARELLRDETPPA